MNSMIIEQVVNSTPLPDLLRSSDAIESIDVLQVDAEGMDDDVIYNSGIDELTPSIIYFEADHLSKGRAAKLMIYLEERGYMLARIKRDMMAVLAAPSQFHLSGIWAPGPARIRRIA